MQPRLRAMTLMALSNKFGHLVLSTGNKSELAVGYCTLYGDMAGGLAVISDVPKTMVYELARWINRYAKRVRDHSKIDNRKTAKRGVETKSKRSGHTAALRNSRSDPAALRGRKPERARHHRARI